MKTQPGIRPLRELAGLYGVQTAYYDVHGQRRTTAVESLLAVLKSMDAPVETLADVPAALEEYAQQHGLRPLEPVLVAWEGHLPFAELHLPMHGKEASLDRISQGKGLPKGSSVGTSCPYRLHDVPEHEVSKSCVDQSGRSVARNAASQRPWHGTGTPQLAQKGHVHLRGVQAAAGGGRGSA